jgi:hypothetical protein
VKQSKLHLIIMVLVINDITPHIHLIGDGGGTAA